MSSSENSSPPSAPPLGKYLASSDKKIRDKATKSLTAFLSQDGIDVVSPSEMDKLWLGIFYCFWMSDKPLVQQALASELAEITLTIPDISATLAFLSGFWRTIGKKWGSIDRLRMDKYQMLVRRFLYATFVLLLRTNWDSEVCQKLNDIYSNPGGPLCHTDAKIPHGLTYHFCDIFLIELDKVTKRFSDGRQPPTSPQTNPPTQGTPLQSLLNPFFILLSQTPNATTFRKVQSEVLEPLFDSLLQASEKQGKEEEERPRKRQKPTSDGEEDNDDRGRFSSIITSTHSSPSAVQTNLLKCYMSIASHEDSRDSNRRKMYAYFKQLGDAEGDDV